jgi:MFS family permease
VVVVWVYVVLYGFGMGGIVVLLPLAVGHYFGVVAFGTIMGLLAFAQAIGSSSGAFISGLMYDHFGNYAHALVLWGVVYFVAVFTIFIAGRPKPYVQS